MNKSNGFQWLFLACVLGIVLLGWRMPGQPSATNASSSVGVATEDAETVFTSSEDGKTVYMWQYFSSKPPKYLGKSEAVLEE